MHGVYRAGCIYMLCYSTARFYEVIHALSCTCFVQLSARVSTGGCAMYSQGRPPPSGERGRRERNFQRKQAKKEKTKAIDMQRLLKGIRDVDTNSENTAANLK